jgi:chaperone required for assembly of F1-ATPase
MPAAFPKKRFYKTARAEAREAGHIVLLDEKPMRTPKGAPLAAPTPALAAAIAAEWADAPDRIDVENMELTRLAVTAIDFGAEGKAAWAEEILKFARSDLLCYRAEEPESLARRQTEVWTPFLDWARASLGATFAATSSIVAISQPEPAIRAIGDRLAKLDPWRLLATRRATEISGSAVLALALEKSAFPPADILAAARLDENFQAERWGWDAEAAEREARIEKDFLNVARFLELLL